MLNSNAFSILVLVAHSRWEDLGNSVWSPTSANASLSCSLDVGMTVFTIFFVMLQHSSASYIHGPTFTCYRVLQLTTTGYWMIYSYLLSFHVYHNWNPWWRFGVHVQVGCTFLSF
uniref:Uncharacterized protein n=1 Tax=Arundo donax TaxID=35708 RepID=A0A0A8YHP2_ARUDO